MIRYALRCARDHGFDSWFRDSAAFETLAEAAQVSCPLCGSTSVRKALMTPSVVTARDRAARPEAEPAPALAPPVAASGTDASILDEQAQRMRAALRAMRQHIAATADDVGRGFAAEARAIHEGAAPARSIYGEATREEVTALLEDDIPLLPLPGLPDEHH